MSSIRALLTCVAAGTILASVAFAAAPATPAPAGPDAGAAPTALGAPGGPRGGRGGRGAGGPGGAPGAGAPRGGGGSILDQVAVQNNDKSRTIHEWHLTKAKLGKGKIDVYVQGDSIMRRWGVDAEVEPNYAKFYAIWKETFWGYNAADFAWGADTIQNILWRMRNGELDDVNPKVTIFLGGTNNVSGSNNVEDMTKGLTACVEEMRKKAPDTTLVIIGILPRQAQYQATIDAINANLAKLADGKKTRFIDLKEKMMTNGQVTQGMLADGLHPDVKGYQVIADAVKPILVEVLGPPKKDDVAPPPTWDPSAANAPTTYPKPAKTN
jgi:lysophospholipase L1-like esterase